MQLFPSRFAWLNLRAHGNTASDLTGQTVQKVMVSITEHVQDGDADLLL